MINSRTSAIEALKRLSRQQTVELACRWSELALPLWEGAFPDDDRPRRAVESAKRLAAGDISSDTVSAAHDAGGKCALSANATHATAYAASASATSAGFAAYAAHAAHARSVGDVRAYSGNVVAYASRVAANAAIASDWPTIDLTYRQYRAELLGVPPELLDAWRGGDPMAEGIIGDWLKERDLEIDSGTEGRE